MSTQTRFLMVCLGNICRSPTAQAVMEKRIADAGLQHHMTVDSAGTAAYHIGKTPDPRSTSAAVRRGYDLSTQRARQVSVDDFHQFDYILAMDNSNLLHLQRMAPDGSADKVSLLLSHVSLGTTDVPDPYYGGDGGFEQVLDLVEQACDALLAVVQSGRRQQVTGER
ncbi:low molecular weight protein-tyrosine-phosphatase [Pseudohongiella acticola]|jgi:low molecular weight protein-tyrosine phosphatase|uniref:low molecular weight protein-tyrosine-phosphatase n=1 Tax=Pseudohongiella acticola TaxID=1524254 RepID=UPI0030EB67D3